MDFDFKEAFDAKIARHEPDFDVTGLLTRDDRVYPLGTDTKVLSTVFELLVRPFVYEIAREHQLIVYEPKKQNYYPDFTLMRSTDDANKIAIDVKTTYRNFRPDGTWYAKFTLGSYVSFLRGETKNIAFPFSEYHKHYIVGFIYTRSNVSTNIYPLTDRQKVQAPFKDVKVFVQEKYRIAGDKPGSGNTENIGSITAGSVEEFEKGNGPFAELGEDVFIDYWRNYPRYKADVKPYTDLAGYHEWKKKNRL